VAGFPGWDYCMPEGAAVAETEPYVEAVSWANVTEFTVTEDHLALLQHAHFYWDYGEGYGAPAINPKRPYGNSYVERDIAEILEAPDSDWEWEDGEKAYPTPEAEERFTRLHVETMIVLHIILAAGEFEPGRYVRDKNTGWVRLEETNTAHP
jgi:hypothetical protein